MTEEQRRKLEQKLWDIANTLRGKMNADEFRDYILGFIFYKYLSERMHLYANEVLRQDELDYLSVREESVEGREILDAVREASVDALGYFLRPSELLSQVAKRGSQPGQFILADLTTILNNIQRSTMGTESEGDFDHLFEDLDLTSTKLGRTEEAKNALITKVLTHLDQINFLLDDANADVLGDAYEYLIGQFASGAGKKAGEFYTPQQVSTILARIVTTGKTRLKSVYDPACGSGSLLLRVAKEADVSEFFGQEMNRTTYNLARMNMILHGVHFRNFDLKQEDTLEHPQHEGMRFEAVVANPPFSANWSSNPLLLSDDRFSQYGKLAPASKADFAFVQHMLHHLDDNGTMAVILPHGALFRGGAEGHIRQYLIKDRNWLDAVIGLPANIFYGTAIPTCILVFKKCREAEDVLFVDASTCFEKATNQNFLRASDIDRIVDTFRNRSEIERFSHRATPEEIAENDYNLNIPRYVDTFEVQVEIDLSGVVARSRIAEEILKTAELSVAEVCKKLSIDPPTGVNIPILKKFKAGLMQKLFTQQLRFSRDNGQAYPEWDVKDLGEIAARCSTKNKDLEYQRVLTNSAVHGVIDQRDFFDKDIANSENLGGYYVVEKGDFVYNPRISVSAPVGPIKRNDLGVGVMSPLYTVFRFHTKETDFFNQYFQTSLWYDYMKSVANYGARHDRMAITISDLMALPLPHPHPEEQKKIANALAALDAKIMAIADDVDNFEKLTTRPSTMFHV